MLTLVRPLDYEVIKQHLLEVKVVDERGQNDVATLTINVNDVNDNPPVLNPAYATLSVSTH